MKNETFTAFNVHLKNYHFCEKIFKNLTIV